MASNPSLTDLHISTIVSSYLFEGVGAQEAAAMLACLGATRRDFEGGQTVLSAGNASRTMGLVLSGSVIIQQVDARGIRTILGRCAAGDTFGESFALTSTSEYAADVVAATDCELLMLNVDRVLKTCPSACAFHNRIIRNLVSAMAQRNLALTRKIACVTPRTIRDRMLAYLGSLTPSPATGHVRTPFNRQQLADYLCVDRSALCHELTKMRDTGTIGFDGNEFWFV